MIKLKNVSKFYYSKGIIASGFTKINLEFNMGEFVAITGESGSGKSTLLNVISGLDSYEEGEMYINGEETSHYTEKDFEDYRRKYIGNIFQNFNLVNSYTVYQNIELVLLLNGKNKKEIKELVYDLIRKVDLYRFRNTKVSKLSGGQKQRVAIARSLAKDTPIIIADEPTGNLDSRSAEGIIKLLSQIAKDKLVIIVTHNYEQVEKYATRKIRMHDGKVLEDKVIKKTNNVSLNDDLVYKNITLFNKFRLGIRNTFNILPKFLLMLLVYAFVVISLIGIYSSFKEQEYNELISGYNNYFRDLSDDRIIITKKDKSSFNDEDYDNIASLSNIENIFKNDLLLDTMINTSDNNEFWLNSYAKDISLLKGNLDLGRMPESDNEIVVMGSIDDYYIGYKGEELLGKELFLTDMYTGSINYNIKLKVVGIKYSSDNNYNYNSSIYMESTVLNDLNLQINEMYSNTRIEMNDKYYTNDSEYFNSVVPSSYVKEGTAIVSNDANYLCSKDNCLNKTLNVNISNLYYEESIELTVSKTFNNKNIMDILGISTDNYINNMSKVFININDYNRLFNKANYQSSVFVKDKEKIDQTITDLDNLGISSLKVRDLIVTSESVAFIQIIKTIVIIIAVVVLFFISYFVIKLILKSRNIYFSTIRMLGSTKKVSKELLLIELMTVFNISYFGFILSILLNKLGIMNIKFFNRILTYVTLNDYILLYIILATMSFIISQKFSKQLFKNSAISTIKEEV